MRLAKMFSAPTLDQAEAKARKWLSHQTEIKNPTMQSMPIRDSEARLIAKKERSWVTTVYYDE